MSPPYQLFPDLPPELRNEIYAYLSLPSPTASTASLPLKLKTFSCRHTSVQICPVHYGSAALLSLQNVLEASEYSSWLLSNVIEVRIGIVFRGRVNTFVQSDWSKKMETHLCKLVKLHPWLSKVSRYDVQILWDPVDGVLKSKKNKRTAGVIPLTMAHTVFGIMDEDVKRRKARVRVSLRLEHRVAVENVLAGTAFGLGNFLAGCKGVKRQTLEVWKVDGRKAVQEKVFAPRLVAREEEKEEERQSISVRGVEVSWVREERESMVMRKCLKQGRLVDMVAGRAVMDGADGYMLRLLADECLEKR